MEDEGLTAMEIQRKLRNWGYEVPSFAFSRKDAVKKAKEIKPDLVLMDIMLKGKGDGVDAAQEIKTIRDIPIIYLTAYDDAKTRKKAETTNPNAYLIKPFEEKELMDKIESALSHHNLGKNLLNIGIKLNNKLNDFGVIIIDFKGDIIYLNDFILELTGLMAEEATGKNINQVFPFNGFNNINSENQLEQFISDNVGIKTRSVLNKGGQDIHVEYSINSIVDEKNRFSGAELIIEDITKNLKHEKSLIEREKRFRSIYSQSILPTQIFDPEGKLLDANLACLSLFGATNIEKIENFNLFNDFALSLKEIQILNDGIEVKSKCKLNFEIFKEMGFESTLKNIDLCLTIFITPLKSDEKVNGYLVQLQDITDFHKLEKSLKISQNHYLNLFNTLDQALLVFDNDLNCVYCNNAITQLSGLKSDDILNKSVQESLKSFWDSEIEATFMKTLETGNPSSVIKRTYVNGIPSYVQIKVLKPSEGLIIALNDITDFKLREKELEKNKELYSSVVNEQNEVICRFNRNFEITFANKAYKRLFGLSNESNSLFSLSKDDKGKMKSHFNSFDETNPVKIFEGPLRMPNGDINWWQWVTKAKFDEEGSISEYQTVGRDLTPQHKALEKIKKEMELAQSAITDKNRELNELKDSLGLEIEGKNRELVELRDSLGLEIEGKNRELVELRDSLGLEIEGKNRELVELKDSLAQEMENKNKELFELEKNYEQEVTVKNQEINSLQEKNELISIKLQEESEKLEDAGKNYTKELQVLLNRENELKKQIKLTKQDIKAKQFEIDNLSRSLEEETHLRQKTEEKLTGASLSVEAQVTKVEKLTSDINILENQLLAKEAEITQIKNSFETEIIQLKTGFEAAITNIEKRELKLKKSIDQKETSIKNVHEGVKKNMQMISTLNRLHSDYITDQMIEKLQDGRSYLRSFGMVHEKLYQSEDLETVNMDSYLNSILDDISRSHGAKNIDINIDTGNISLDMETAVNSGLIITELVINSIKHAFPDANEGMINVKVSNDDNDLIINVSDDGVGIPRRISEAGVDSFGLQLIKTLVEQSEGNMEFNGDNGAKYTIHIPNVNISV